MAVGANHDLSRKDETLFGKKDMFDSALTDLEVMGEALGLCELAKNFALLGRGNVFGRGEVIGNEDDPVPVKNFLYSDLPEGLDGKGHGNIVGKGEVDPHIDQFARDDRLFARMGSKNLFRDGHGILFLHIHPVLQKKVEAEVKVKKRIMNLHLNLNLNLNLRMRFTFLPVSAF